MTRDGGNGSEFRASEPTANPAATLLRGGAIPGVATGLGVAVCALVAGPMEAGSAAFGGALAAAALAVGPLLLKLGREYSPIGLMALAITGYSATVVVLGVLLILFRDASWLVGGYAGLGVLATTAAWLAGQARATGRLRVLVFGSEPDPIQGPFRWPGAVQEPADEADGESVRSS